MAYTVHLTVGFQRLFGDGYPTFNKDGTIKLPDGQTIPPGKYRTVQVRSEAAPDFTGIGTSSRPRKQAATTPRRSRTKRMSDHQEPRERKSRRKK
jgi:hypothetical protein